MDCQSALTQTDKADGKSLENFVTEKRYAANTKLRSILDGNGIGFDHN